MEKLNQAINNIRLVIGNARMTRQEHVELEANIKYVEDLAKQQFKDIKPPPEIIECAREPEE